MPKDTTPKNQETVVPHIPRTALHCTPHSPPLHTPVTPVQSSDSNSGPHILTPNPTQSHPTQPNHTQYIHPTSIFSRACSVQRAKPATQYTEPQFDPPALLHSISSPVQSSPAPLLFCSSPVHTWPIYAIAPHAATYSNLSICSPLALALAQSRTGQGRAGRARQGEASEMAGAFLTW
jgi:hypothetical protein